MPPWGGATLGTCGVLLGAHSRETLGTTMGMCWVLLWGRMGSYPWGPAGRHHWDMLGAPRGHTGCHPGVLLGATMGHAGCRCEGCM